MSAFLILMLLLLANRQGGGALTSSNSDTPLAAQAAHAQIEATVKQTQAKGSPDPKKHAQAAQAQKKADTLTKAAQSQAKAQATPPPWPQAMPAGLPAFPSGWQPDEPPPQPVQTRAWQLLPVLWKTGAGSRKTEQTTGRWITYVATPMGAKKGVVAYRPRPGAPPASSATPATNLATYAPSSQPTIRQGSTGPAVTRWQQIIGVAADGKFGPGTLAKTKAWQASHGLTADGVVGPATWAAATGAGSVRV